MSPSMRTFGGLSASLAALVWLSGIARADVIPAGRPRPVCAPITCPSGSTPFGTGHGACPADCTPWNMECSPDGSCQDGWTCVPARFCVEEGFMGRTNGPIVRGECAADGSCEVGVCWSAPRCIPAPPAATAAVLPSGDEPSCAAQPGPGEAVPALFGSLGVLFVLGLFRRASWRRRPRVARVMRALGH